MGAIIATEWQQDVFAALLRIERTVLATLRPVTRRLEPIVERIRDKVGV